MSGRGGRRDELPGREAEAAPVIVDLERFRLIEIDVADHDQVGMVDIEGLPRAGDDADGDEQPLTDTGLDAFRSEQGSVSVV